MTNTHMALLQKLRSGQANVAIIGMGYVGLPLAVSFARVGYCVTGIDLNSEKVDAINRGESYVEDVTAEMLTSLIAAEPALELAGAPELADRPTSSAIRTVGSLQATTDYDILAECDAVSICVPTPLNKTGEPDISYIIAASEEIAARLHSGMVIVLESTTYPGTTSEVILPRLEAARPDLKLGEDFFLAFSPERIDPGRSDWTVETMPKVIGGSTPACLEVASSFYGPAVGPLVPVSSPDTAEMVKLFENTFRSVNIGLANELLLMCDKLGLDAWEVLDAAATKPFGFMKFTPGPGLGGHCIPVDPHYLSWKLRTLDYNARFIDLASEINTDMPRYWVQKVQDLLNDAAKPVKGSNILILGVAYKKNVADLRESPALDILYLLDAKGARVAYHDPFVPFLTYEGLSLAGVQDLDAALDAADCVVVATDHDQYNWEAVQDRADLIVDTRHVL